MTKKKLKAHFPLRRYFGMFYILLGVLSSILLSSGFTLYNGLEKNESDPTFDFIWDTIEKKETELAYNNDIYNPLEHRGAKGSHLAASLAINVTTDQSSYLTGESFTYRIGYRCASLTDDCIGTMITDPLPPALEYVGLFGSTHTTFETYNATTHAVTFTFQNPLLAGSTGEVLITVRFPNGSTPNNTIASNTATISASNAPSVNSNLDITAVASAKPELNKQLFSGGAIDGHTSILLSFCNNISTSNQDGTLTLYNVSIIDTLEPGSTYLGSNLAGADTAIYDAANHVVTFLIDTLRPGQCMYPRPIIEYPSPTFTAGQTVTNTAYYHYTPIGVPAQSDTRFLSFDLTNPYPYASSYKTNSHGSNFTGNGGQYNIGAAVSGTQELADFCVVDSIPVGIEVTRFRPGAWYYSGLSGPEDIIDVYYTTNLNGPQLVPGSPFSIYDYPQIELSDIGLTEGGAEYITVLSFCFGDAPVGFFQNSPISIDYLIMPNAPSGTSVNCAFLSSTTPGADLDFGCTSFEIIPNDPGIKLNPVKGTATGGIFNRGDTIDFQLVPRNEFGAADSLADPIIYDLLPEGVTYVPGSWYLPAWGNLSGLPDPDFTYTPNYKGTGRDLVRWEWSGSSSIKIPSGDRIAIEFKAVITETALGGSPAFYNYFYVQTPTTPVDCWGNGARQDSFDLDDDGDFTEVLCGGRHAVDINEVVSLESEKLVLGQLDSTWTKYPDVAATVPGGITDYRLIVSNTGNIVMDSIIVVDILPHLNDRGVIDLSLRESKWTPNLVGQVSVPAGVLVYYSTESNPCRSDEMIVPSGPSGCSLANWSSTPPLDITTVRSLKFEFGSVTLNPGDSLVLEWPMRAPANALAGIGAVPDSIAWNSFGYIGQRVDNGNYTLPTEPIKVGVNLNNDIPAIIGDRVWLDANNNGVQDLGEGGFDGVRIDLFKDNGDAISNPAIDTFINFTVTANDGYFLFPTLPSGDYYLVFYKPPTYNISTPDQGGNDARDSDGIQGSYNGHTVAITPVTNLTSVEYDLTWDLGLHPSGLAAVGNYVWSDSDNDGTQNESNTEGINGVVINLFNNLNPGVIIASYLTFDNPSGNPGYYLFDNLAPGDYYIQPILPNSTSLTLQGSTGSSDPLDSDVNAISGYSDVLSLISNQYDDNWDIGLILSPIEICGNNFDDDLDGLIDEDCPENCTDGIDNDGDGLVDCFDCEECGSSGLCADNDADLIGDYCDLDDDNDGIPDIEEGHICEVLDISTLDGTISTVADFNAEQINISGAIIQLEDPLTFDGLASIDEFGVNDDHETGSYGLQLGVFSSGPSDYLEARYSFSKEVCNFNARILDIDVSDALEVYGYLNGVAVGFNVNYLGVCVNYDLSNTFSSICIVNASPGLGNVGYHAVNIQFDNCIDSMRIRSYENGSSIGGSYTFVLSPYPSCTSVDTDNDGVANHIDLDSDNDGIFDLIESGHSAVDVNNDGIIDGAASTFGTNGLFDGVEIVADNGIINYGISDSESTADGIYDPYEIDSDGDGCYDTFEAQVPDLDEDGIAGPGSPAISTSGLVIGNIYTVPPNTNWTNHLINECALCKTATTNPHVMYFRSN